MHAHVRALSVKRKSCFCHFFVLGTTADEGFKPTSRHKPASLALIPLFPLLSLPLLLPSLICYDAAFNVALTCHLWPRLSTYLDILFMLRSNFQPQWHTDYDVHSGNSRQVLLWSWKGIFQRPPFSRYRSSSTWQLTWQHNSKASRIATVMATQILQ